MENEIHSVDEFLKTIKTPRGINKSLQMDGRGLTERIFYRGQSADFKNTNNVASIFRSKNSSGYTNEYSFTNEYMRRFAEKFNNLENNFSRLSYMQHFTLPTRLLDVTTNPLVSLYFACQPSMNSGEVASAKNIKSSRGVISLFISSINQKIDSSGNSYSFYNSRSDTVEILSTLALMPEDKKKIIFYNIAEFNNKVENLENENNISYEKWYMSYVGKIEKSETDPDKLKSYKEIERLYKQINESYEIQCLYHDLKRDSGYFAEVINFRNLIHPFFVEPSLNNPRLRAQSGFFLFEPYDGVTKRLNEISEDIGELSIGTIYIPEESKATILLELDHLFEINKATLFPDEESVANYVATDFKKTLKIKL